MIPRLWVCTSHPVLQALTLPLQRLVILALAVAAWLVGNRSGGVWAMRLRRLWVTLALAVLIGFLLIALPGWVVVKIGGNGNPIFVAARYLWVGLAWSAVWVGLAWGKRDVAALPLAARVTAPATYASVYGFGALVVIVVIVARFFISDKQVPWSDPYFIGEWLFDMATTDLASDECLAFRSQDDQQVRRMGSGRTRDASAQEQRFERHSGHRRVPD